MQYLACACRHAWFAPRIKGWPWLGPSPALLSPNTTELSYVGKLYKGIMEPSDAGLAALQVAAAPGVGLPRTWQDACGLCFDVVGDGPTQPRILSMAAPEFVSRCQECGVWQFSHELMQAAGLKSYDSHGDGVHEA